MGLFLGSLFCSIDLYVCFYSSIMLFWFLWPYSTCNLILGSKRTYRWLKDIQRSSTSLIIRKMQMKTTMRHHHLTPVRMAIINNSTHNCWWECGKRGTFLHCWWKYRLVQPLWKAVWKHLKKLKMDLPYNQAIPLLGIYPKKPKILIQKNICTPKIIAALFTTAKIWKQPKCPSVDEWIKQL